MADRTLFFMTLIPPEDIHPKATGSSKTPDRKPLGSLPLSIERMVSGRIGLPLLRCWPPEWVSGEEAEAVAIGVNAFGLAPRRRKQLGPQSIPLGFPVKTPRRPNEASVRHTRCTLPPRPAAA